MRGPSSIPARVGWASQPVKQKGGLARPQFRNAYAVAGARRAVGGRLLHVL